MDSDPVGAGLPRPDSASLVRTPCMDRNYPKEIDRINQPSTVFETDGDPPRHPAGKRDLRSLSSGDLCSPPGKWETHFIFNQCPSMFPRFFKRRKRRNWHSTQSKTYDALFKSQVQEYRASSVPLDLSGGPLLGLSCLRPVLPGKVAVAFLKTPHHRSSPKISDFWQGESGYCCECDPLTFCSHRIQFLKSPAWLFKASTIFGKWQVGRVRPVQLQESSNPSLRTRSHIIVNIQQSRQTNKYSRSRSDQHCLTTSTSVDTILMQL